MVIRPSAATANSGAESSAHVEEPAKRTGRRAAVATLPAPVNNTQIGLGAPYYGSAGGLVVSPHPALLPAPAARVSSAPETGPDLVAPSSLARQLPIDVPPGGATRHNTVTARWTLPRQVGRGVPRLATTYDISVFDLQSGRW